MKKEMVALLLALCVLPGCGADPQKPETSEPQESTVTQDVAKENGQEKVTIIMGALLTGEQTVEEYVAKLEDPTAKVYDEKHYTIEITEERRREVVARCYEESIAQLQSIAGAGAEIKADEYLLNIDVTGEIAEPFSFAVMSGILADAVQAYNLIDPAERACEITLNGKALF